MSKAHELLARKPFDLYQLHLFRLVAESGSFTRAAHITGLTQSAISRQVQGIEQQLGLSLFNRTTCSVNQPRFWEMSMCSCGGCARISPARHGKCASAFPGV
jgi:hypothetical protein